MTDAPLAAVLYGRQSQDHDRSIDEQLDIGADRVAAEGWRLHARYSEGMSASRHATRKRDEWPKVLADIDAGRVHMLWLWESSRGDRTLSSWARLLESCREHGVLIYVETHGRAYDMSRARDWRTLAEDGVDNAYEADKTSERVRRAMAANATAGKVHGRTPYGYRREYQTDRRGRRTLVAQVPDETEAPVVKRIFTMLADGVPLRSVVRTLTTEQVPTRSGAAWSMTSVRNLALNRAYIAQRVHDPEGRRTRVHLPSPDAAYYPAEWPPIVDDETFWAVHRLLQDQARTTTRPGKVKHLLSGIAVCGECGATVTVKLGGGGAYTCRNSCVRIAQADLDDYVTGEVLRYLARPRVWRKLVAASDRTSRELDEARGKLAALQADYDDTVALFRARQISPGAFAAVEPGKLADLETARTRVRDLETPAPLRFLRDAAGDLDARWTDAPVAARRGAIRALCSVTVHQAPRFGPVRVPAAERTDIDWR